MTVIQLITDKSIGNKYRNIISKKLSDLFKVPELYKTMFADTLSMLDKESPSQTTCNCNWLVQDMVEMNICQVAPVKHFKSFY